MANQRLTDKPELTSPALDDKFEVVDVSDTTQNSAGSTKWIKWSTLKSFFLKYTGLSDVLDTTLQGKEGQVPTVYTPVGASTPKLKLTPLPSFTELYSGNTVINGGIIKLGLTDLSYKVWATSFIINNIKYDEFVTANKTLSDGDPTHPRIDVFAIEVNAFAYPPTFSVVVIEGTPAASPVKPTVNLATQVEVSFSVVAAAATTDPNTVLDLIYDEATGEPDEWGNTHLVAGGNLTDASDPFLGTVSLNIPSLANDYVSWTNLTDISYTTDQKLNFAIKLTAWNGGQTIEFKLIDTATSNYRILSINSINAVNYGIDITSTSWQVAQIPISRFISQSSTTTFDRLHITFTGNAPMLLDWINVQSGLNQPPTYTYVKSVVAGTNIVVDNTDPERPIVNMLTSSFILAGYTIGTLPPPSIGKIVYITDGQTYGASASGSTVSTTGSTKRPVFYDGTNWIYV
jgi:hypothetical protein